MGDSGSGYDKMKDRHHSTAALLHPCRLYRTPYGGHPLPQHPPQHPPRFLHLQSYPPLLPTECPLFPTGKGNQKNKIPNQTITYLWLFYYHKRTAPSHFTSPPHDLLHSLEKSSTHTVWAAPFALWGFLHVWVQANHVVGTRAGITQYNFSPLLAHLTVVLVISLIAIHSHRGVLLTCRWWWRVTAVQATGTGFLQ